MLAMVTFIHRETVRPKEAAPSKHKGSYSSHSLSKEPSPKIVRPSSSKEKNAAYRPDWVGEIIECQIESASGLSHLEKQARLNKKLKSDNNIKEFIFKRRQ